MIGLGERVVVKDRLDRLGSDGHMASIPKVLAEPVVCRRHAASPTPPKRVCQGSLEPREQRVCPRESDPPFSGHHHLMAPARRTILLLGGVRGGVMP